jgi:hypothetical protein
VVCSRLEGIEQFRPFRISARRFCDDNSVTDGGVLALLSSSTNFVVTRELYVSNLVRR